MSLSSFRDLRDAFPSEGEVRALAVWYLLYRELNFKARDGVAMGRIPARDMASFIRELQERLGEAGAVITADKLVEVRLGEWDGGDFVCPKFIVEHSGVSEQRSREQRGGDMRAFNSRVRKDQEGVAQLALIIPRERYVDPETQAPLSGEDVKRVNLLIRVADGALYKNSRPPLGFTAGLLAEAVRVLKKFTDEEINITMELVARKRGHPYLANMTAEKLLPEFGNIASKLGGIDA